MRTRLLLFLIYISSATNAQIFDTNAAQMVIDAQSEYVRAYGQMTQRAIQISRMVQPQREQMYQKAIEGNYYDAIRILNDVDNKYIYYVFDNRGIRDMLSLGGDCAVNLEAYDLAIILFNRAKEAEEPGMENKLYNVFSKTMINARNSYRKGDYIALWKAVDLALKTGWENGECYYYKGICFENASNLNEGEKYKLARKMYKLAKKKKYSPAITALKELKKKK